MRAVITTVLEFGMSLGVVVGYVEFALAALAGVAAISAVATFLFLVL